MIMSRLLIGLLIVAIVLAAVIVGDWIAPVNECTEYISEQWRDNPNGC